MSNLRLFHARFPFGQRQQIERDVLSAFGLPSLGPRPIRPCLLIAKHKSSNKAWTSTSICWSRTSHRSTLCSNARVDCNVTLVRRNNVHLQTAQLWIIEPDVDDVGTPDFGKSEYVYSRYVLLEVLPGRSGIGARSTCRTISSGSSRRFTATNRFP